jgi:hypothetical protein
MAADVTVFDPAAVIDHATYDDPARPSAGIREVIVNGHVALHDGKATGERGGRSLIRTDHMPSRPFELCGSHHVTFSGTINKVRLTIDLSQPASARHATGTLRIDDPLNALHEEMRDFGLLQVTDGWASITGILKTRGGDDQSATVIIDQKNPMGVEHGAAIVIDEEKGTHVSGTVAPASVKISR